MARISRSAPATMIIPSPLDMVVTLRRKIRHFQKRREVTKLLDCDDRILKDMGITHGDVVEALSKRGNASLHLRALAARRRFWTRSRDKL